MEGGGDPEPNPAHDASAPAPAPAPPPPPARSAARVALVALVAVVAVAAAVLIAWLWLAGPDEGGAGDPGTDSSAPGATIGSSTGDSSGSAPGSGSDGSGSSPLEPVPTTEPVPTAARATYDAACAEGLATVVAPGVADTNLVEVSGVAVDLSGVAWVINDSGDRPRLYGVRADGSVQTVDVTGADAVDWEDLVLQHAGERSVLWIADTGSNIEPRGTVQLYRVPVPAAGQTSVAASRFDVTYPDGSHDVEAVMVDQSGSVVLITKDPGTPALYRVEPSASSVTAERIGTFTVGDGERTVVTSADLAADGSAVVLRTYGSVYLVPVEPQEPLIDALADRESHCRGVPPMELQGEAVSFLPDGTGYVTMGEGVHPYLTTVTVAPDGAPSTSSP